MRKLISATMMGVLLTSFGVGISGCSDETSEKKETQIKTPGGTTTVTDEMKVKKTGENPPPATKP